MRLSKKKSLIDQASGYIEVRLPQIESAVASAAESVRTTALPLLADARDKAGPALADARAKAGPMLADARDRAAPYLADARDKAGPALADARAKAAPLIASGAALAAEKAAAGRDLASAKVASLKAEPEPRKGSKLRKIALFAGLATVVGVIAKKLQAGKSGGASDNWQSSYVPAPAPKPPTTGAHSSTHAPADDAGGSSPDEAIADLAEEPHPVTTPDDPAEVVPLEDEK